MPVWCRYCHEEGHTKYGCKKAMANILCYAFDYPEPKSNRTQKNRFYKKARKTPLLNSEEIVENPRVSKEVNNPSSELHQSKWAPNQTSQRRDNNEDSEKEEENKHEENNDEENNDEKQKNKENVTNPITIYNDDIDEIMKDIAVLHDIFNDEDDNNEDGDISMFNGDETSGEGYNSSITNRRQSSVQPQYLQTQLRRSARLAQNSYSGNTPINSFS